MHQIARHLCRAGHIDTPQDRFPFLAFSDTAAGGAGGGDLVGRRPLLMVRNRHHFGDDVPRLAHDDPVPDSHPFFVDKILVVENRAADCCSSKGNRLKNRGRGERTGAPDLDQDVAQGGFLFFGRVFERDCPARELRGCTQQFPVGEAVHLDDRAVNVERELVPRFSNPLHLGDRRFYFGKPLTGRDHLESLFL